jgi:hypothetical protein
MRADVADSGGTARSATGSCARCRRSLDLASVKVDGNWYGREICATGGPCPLEESAPRVPETRLINRPLRFFRRRPPKELRRVSV